MIWRCSWPAWKRVCVRRTRRNAQYGFGPLQMNLLSGRAYIGETDLNLTQKEFAALLYLARHPNRSVSAQELYEAVWQQPMGADPHAVRMTISRLKQKLGGEDARVTVNSYRSSGYRLEEQ